MRNIIVVWLAIMMLAGGMIGVANPSQAAPETKGTHNLTAVYVGGDCVHLKWDWDYVPDSADSPYTGILYRDGVAIYDYTSSNPSGLVYIDSGVTRGSHQYQCIESNATVTKNGNVETVNVGRVSGIIRADTTLTPAGNPHVLCKDISSDGLKIEATLTIQPGVEIIMEDNASIYGGRLMASGSSAQPIIITANVVDGGSYIQLGGNDSYMDYCVVDDIRHIRVLDSPTISNCTISHNIDGIYIDCNAYHPKIVNNLIHNNSQSAVNDYGSEGAVITGNIIEHNPNGVYFPYRFTITDISTPTITDNIFRYNGDGIDFWSDYVYPVAVSNNQFYDNIEYGLSKFSWSHYIDATNNWWGSADGPGGVGPGSGDNVSGNVLYDPWIGKVDPNVTVDLSIDRVEVIQVVNGASLIAGKESIVMVWVNTRGVAVQGVNVQVMFDGVPLKRYDPSQPKDAVPGYTNVKDIPVRFSTRDMATCSDSFNFGVIMNPAAGSREIIAQVDPLNSIQETNEMNNMVLNTVEIHDTKSMHLGFKPYYVANPLISGKKDPTVSVDAFAENAVRFMRDIYPLQYSDMQYSVCVPYYAPSPLGNWKADTFFNLVWMKEYIITMNMISMLAGEPMDAVVFITPTDYIGGNGGLSYRGFRSTPFVCEDNPLETAHEVAHSFGLRLDPEEYDVPDSPDGTDLTGMRIFNAGENRLFSIPQGAPDNAMLYCVMGPTHDQKWIEPYCFDFLFDKLRVTRGGERISTRSAGSDKTVLVKGMVYQNGSVQLLPSLLLDGTAPLEDDPAGSYSIDLVDAGNVVLSSVRFEPDFATFDPYPFCFAVPYDNNTARVVVRHGAADMGDIIPTANPPTVTVTDLNGGESLTGIHNVTWTANDIDGDTLTYTLLYSSDSGTNWTIFAQGLTDTWFNLNTSHFPGTTKGKIKVVATDGFNVGEDETNGMFAISKKAPEAGILTASGQIFATGSNVRLEGYGYDKEDGPLNAPSLAWTSNLDGLLGSGGQLETTSLSSGTHTITLNVVDSDGQNSQSAITLTIADDLTPPTIGTITTTPKPVYSGKTLTVTADVIDTLGLAPFGVEIEVDGVRDLMWFNSTSGLFEATITAPLSAGTYYLIVSALDTAGNTASRNVTFTVTGYPQSITGLTATDENDGKIMLKWTPTDISDFKEYRIYVSDSLITNVFGMTPVATITDPNVYEFLIEGLEDDKLYYFAVTVVDQDGNENLEVTAVSATSTPLIDQPQLSNLWLLTMLAAVAVGVVVIVIIVKKRGGQEDGPPPQQQWQQPPPPPPLP